MTGQVDFILIVVENFWFSLALWDWHRYPHGVWRKHKDKLDQAVDRDMYHCKGVLLLILMVHITRLHFGNATSRPSKLGDGSRPFVRIAKNSLKAAP